MGSNGRRKVWDKSKGGWHDKSLFDSFMQGMQQGIASEQDLLEESSSVVIDVEESNVEMHDVGDYDSWQSELAAAAAEKNRRRKLFGMSLALDLAVRLMVESDEVLSESGDCEEACEQLHRFVHGDHGLVQHMIVNDEPWETRRPQTCFGTPSCLQGWGGSTWGGSTLREYCGTVV